VGEWLIETSGEWWGLASSSDGAVAVVAKKKVKEVK
jgi:hypothetical protein